MKTTSFFVVLFLLIGGLTSVSLADHASPVPSPEHPSGACSAPFHVQAAQWNFCWQQDDVRAQGVELNQVFFHGEPVIAKIGFPFSITRYEDDRYGPFKDTLGQSFVGGQNPGYGLGAMTIHPAQCPRFLGAGVLLNDGRICLEQRTGPEPAVAIWGRYDIFNYRFLQGYTLDSRGVIEPFVRLGGFLIDGAAGGATGTNHFHHLYWRVDLDVGDTPENGFQMFVRPHEDWNDWEPYVSWTPSENGSTAPVACSLFNDSQLPPPCRGHTSDGTFEMVDPLADWPMACREQVTQGVTGWCDVDAEAALVHHPALATKWRVHNPLDTNAWGRAKSFESTGQTHHNARLDGDFAYFDALVLQHMGNSQEIGFEVPRTPREGDAYLRAYHEQAQAVDDPVVWFAARTYHDTRDEEEPTMTYHHASFTLEPRNFLARNLGEDTYARGPSMPSPGGIEPGPCIGPVCT